MKLKKFALRGLIALTVTVALCMFFSRTVQTITTPKVQVITAEKGRFEEKLTYTAQVYFAQTETMIVDNPYGMVAEQIHIQPGMHVNAGDAIFTLILPGYWEQEAALQAEYSALSTELMELDAAHYGMPQESPLTDLYADMAAANAALDEAVYADRLSALQNGTAMPEKVQAAQTAYDEARAAYHAYIVENPESEAILAYVNARDKLVADLEALTAQMLALDLAMLQNQTISAPRSGYIAAIDAGSLAYTITAEGCEPVLRCLAPGRSIAEGTRADVVTDLYGTKRSAVAGMTGSFLHITIPEGLTDALPTLMEFGAQVNITNRAKQATTLLPISALRGSGEDTYVYQVKYTYGGMLASKSLMVVKVPVTVIERSSTTVSIAEDLEGDNLAVREDRLLTDGQTVMLYVN